jgi:hypothetical protein
MTSEPAVQDEVHVQIIKALNMLLEVCILSFTSRIVWTKAHFQTRYPTNAGHQAAQTLFYPQWGRSCLKAHHTPGEKTNASFPDFCSK